MKLHSNFQTVGFGLLLAIASAPADTLTFIASPDIHGVINYSWFSTDNWYTNQAGTGTLYHMGRLPVPGDTAVLRTEVNAALNNIYISTLIVGGNAVNGGNFIVNASLQTGTGATFTDSTLEIQSQWLATNACSLARSTVTVNAGAYVQLFKAPSLTTPGLFLWDSTLFNVGQIILTDGTMLSSAGGTNRLNNLPNAVISGTGTNRVTNNNVGGAWLIFDNDGRVECDSGTLRFDGWNVVWTNSHGLGKFKTTATNATLDVYGLTVPASATYIFSGPGLSRLNADGGATVQGVLSIGAVDPGSKAIDVGTLESAADLTGTGMVHVVASPGFPSMLNLSGGAISLSTVMIDAGGQLKITGTVGGVSFRGTTVNNSATATWTGEGNGLGMYNGATFNNLAGALFDAQNDDALLGGAGSDGTFNNAGTFRKSAGTNDTFFWYSYSPGVTFNNTGLLDVQSGRVVLMGGTNSGQFNVAPGARLRFWRSPYILAAGATFTGAGSVTLGGNSPSLLVNTDVSLGNFTCGDDSSSVLDGPGMFTLAGSNIWSHGTMQGSGAVNIASNASFTLGGVGVTLNQRTVNNAGSVTCTYGFSAGKGAVFNNLAGGVLNLTVQNMGFDYTGSGAVPVFNNAGSVLVPVSFWPNMNWVFTNSGLVQVLGADVNFGRGLTQTAGSTVVAAGATLSLASATPLLLKGGSLVGAGKIDGSVVNGATINLGAAPSILQVNGGYAPSYTQNPNGVLAIKIGGHTAGTQLDQLAIINNGAGALNGTLAVSFINGFVPALGDSFPVVTFGSSSGAFAAVTGNRSGNGLVLVPRNTGSSIALVAANDLGISQPSLNGGRYSFKFGTTTGFSYVVEYTGSLTPPSQWHTLTNIAGNGSTVSVADPAPPGSQRFYRVRFQ